jgi:hypothetical protein
MLSWIASSSGDLAGESRASSLLEIFSGAVAIKLGD